MNQNIINNNITNMSYMFEECEALLELSNISQWNTSNVNDISYMFNQCKSLFSLPDISKWNNSKVIDMSGIFKGCKILSSLPDSLNGILQILYICIICLVNVNY